MQCTIQGGLLVRNILELRFKERKFLLKLAACSYCALCQAIFFCTPANQSARVANGDLLSTQYDTSFVRRPVQVMK